MITGTEDVVVVVASTNPGKAREFSALLPAGTRILTLRDLDLEAPEESGTSFAENAAMKAVQTSTRTPHFVIADDSGLVVDALSGEPGVRSARYAGEPSNDERNRQLVLTRMADVPTDRRAARFCCAISVACRGVVLAKAFGVCEGSVATVSRGSHGFGYDPIFLLPDGRTMAEVTPDEKNRISHRARAFQQIAPRLAHMLSGQRRDGDALS
jgi:XTP/dITP diphosphohydrolase